MYVLNKANAQDTLDRFINENFTDLDLYERIIKIKRIIKTGIYVYCKINNYRWFM